MDPDNVSGSIAFSAPKLSRMSETFEQQSSGAGLTPAQCALIRASLNKVHLEATRLVQRADVVTEQVLTRRSSRSALGAQVAHQADGSSRESR